MLLLLRSQEIEDELAESVAEKLAHILNCKVEVQYMDELEEINNLTGVAIVLSKEKIGEDLVISDSNNAKAAIVEAGEINETICRALHALGHIFGCSHCTNKKCFLFPYNIERELPKNIDEAFCKDCLSILKNSPLYEQIMQDYDKAIGQQENQENFPSFPLSDSIEEVARFMLEVLDYYNVELED